VVIALADGVHNVFWLWHEVRERFEKVLDARSGIVPSHTPLLSRPSPGAGTHSTVPGSGLCAAHELPVGARTCGFVCVKAREEIFHTKQVSRRVGLGQIFSGAFGEL
jgi:hypothetical protein